MCAATQKPESEFSGDDDRRGVCRCPGSGHYSDLMLEAMQTSVVFFNNDGTVYRSNSLACKDLHFDGDLVGHNLLKLLTVVCDENDILSGILDRFKEPETMQVKLPSGSMVRCSLTNVQFFVRGSITRLECGRFLFAFRNIMDEITREQILSMILARTKIFPWFYDMDRNKMLIDAHWFSYLGIPAGDCTITQEEFFARVHPEERETLSEALRLQLSEQEIQDSFSYRLMRGDGSWEWFSAQSMYLSRTGDGSPYRVVGVCQSIHEHKTIEENLRSARDKAEESERLKSAFLANMSHEIRTPLNAIVGFSNLLTEGEIDLHDADAREYASLISKNCDYLITLVTDILDLSRIETGSMEYCFATHSLRQILCGIYEKYAGRMPEEIKLNLLLPPGDLLVETDLLRLRQVVENLVGNAVKFTAKGRIDIGYLPAGEDRNVRLFVADTGRGIPPEETEKIFDRFYKIDSFQQGTGLGLSVCKTILEGMGGQIVVSSQPGKGSRFTVKIPLIQQKNMTL